MDAFRLVHQHDMAGGRYVVRAKLVRAVPDDVLQLERDDFPLPKLQSRLARIEDELINGRGFVRLRGVDRRAYSQTEMEVLYWGIGMHLGQMIHHESTQSQV